MWLQSNRRDQYVLPLNQEGHCLCVKWTRNICYRIKLRDNRNPSSAFNITGENICKVLWKRRVQWIAASGSVSLWLLSPCCQHWGHDSKVNSYRPMTWWKWRKETRGMNALLNKNTASVCGNTLEIICWSTTYTGPLRPQLAGNMLPTTQCYVTRRDIWNEKTLVEIKCIHIRRNTTVFSNCWRKQLHVSALFWVGHHHVETRISGKTHILQCGHQQWGNEISFRDLVPSFLMSTL
jgi:hypothetical protein